MASATMTSKGQITVPKEVRDALHLEPGAKIDFRVENGEAVMRAKSWDVRKLKGIDQAASRRSRNDRGNERSHRRKDGRG